MANICLLSHLQSWRRVDSWQTRVWMPQDLSASSARLGWEEMVLSETIGVESHYLTKMFNQTPSYSTNDLSGLLYLITWLLLLLLSVPGALRHLHLNLWFLPCLCILSLSSSLLLMSFKLMDPTLFFQPLLQKAKKTASQQRAQHEETPLKE